MDLVGDDRAQSIQIGAVLLFAVLIIAFSSYQAFVVPEQNRQVEFNHNQDVQSQMQDLRNTIVSASDSSGSQAVSVDLGTQYPSRAIAQNPGLPSGSLRTVGTTDESVGLTIDNAQTAGETGDFWNTSRSYNTGAISYSPQYNVYTSPPDTVYDNTVLYNSFRAGNVTVANQSFIDGNDISLVVVNGSLSRSSGGSTSVDVRPTSASTQTVRLEDDGGSDPINITFSSPRSAEYWDFLETTQPNVDAVTSTGPTDGFYEVSVELATGQAYDLEMTRVGVGTSVTDEDTAYLTDTDGDGTTLSEGETTELTLEVRDRFNNPPDNASETTVTAEADSGILGSTGTSASATPDEDGEVTFAYTAPDSTGEQDIRVTYGSFDGTFTESTPQDVVMTVDVSSSGGGGGGGAYAVDWIRPPFTQGLVNESLATRANLRTTPVLLRATDGSNSVAFVDIDYGVSDSAVVDTNESGGETNVTGYNSTSANWQSDGYATIYAASGGGSDSVAYTYDRLLNESFEDEEGALVSNGWYYNDSNPNGGSAGVTESTGSPAGDNLAFIGGDAGTGDRAIELNYSLDTSSYDAFTLTYVLRENGSSGVDNPDVPSSGSNWEPGENLYVQYQDSDGSWVTVDNVSSTTDSGLPETFPRRTLIQGVDNASHTDFEIRFVQRETTAEDRWELDAIDVIGLSSTEETGLNQAPVPALRYVPESPSSGATILFDANRSDDPDGDDSPSNGNYLSYEWDWDDDGTYEATGEEASHSYSNSGDQTVTLRVTDARGATAITTQTVSVGSGGGGGNSLSNPENPGFAYEDVNQDGQYQSSIDNQLTRSDLIGTYSTGAGNALVVPDSVGALDTNTDIDWSADGMFVGVDVDDQSSVSFDSESGPLTVDGNRLDSLGPITATGDTVDVSGVTANNYQNGNGNGNDIQFTATGGTVDASNAQVAGADNITLDGTGVTATSATLDNYQNGNGGGSVDVVAGSGTADIGTSTTRSLNDINVSGTDVAASGVTLNNFQDGNGNGRAIRLEANGGDVTATSSSTFDTASDLIVSGTNVDVSGSTFDNDQNGNGNGNIDVTASGDLTATTTSFQSLNAVNVTGGTVDVSSATINNFQNGNGNGRDIQVDATSGSLTGTGVGIDSNAQIELVGDTMDISDADLNNYQNSNGAGDIRLETRTGDMVVERAILTTNGNNRAFGVDTSGDDLFVQDAEFYVNNANGNNGELINENAVDVDGTPARGGVTI